DYARCLCCPRTRLRAELRSHPLGRRMLRYCPPPLALCRDAERGQRRTHERRSKSVPIHPSAGSVEGGALSLPTLPRRSSPASLHHQDEPEGESLSLERDESHPVGQRRRSHRPSSSTQAASRLGAPQPTHAARH